MENSYKFKVAGHIFRAVLPEGALVEDVLQPYLPFLYPTDEEPIYTLRMEYSDDMKSLDAGEVKECLNDEAPYFWIFDRDGKLNFGFSNSKRRPDCIMFTSDDYSEGVVYVPRSGSVRLVEFSLTNAMMLMFTFRTSGMDTLMTHSSVIRYNDEGYMFLGRSGTGKSTHSSLWLKNIEGTSLLNDDNPVVRVVDGKAYIYGTPWSGKTPCYKNEAVPLKAVVRIAQAPFNRITRLPLLQSYASLLPSCSCMRWDRNATDSLHKSVEKVVSKVACWHLECLPDADAAHTCFNAVTK